MKQEEVDDEEEEDDDDPDLFQIEDDDNMNEDFLYVVKKSLIIDEWKKRKFQIEKESRIIGKSKIANLGSMMATSFKKHLKRQDSTTKSQRIVKKEDADNQGGWGIRTNVNPNQKQITINKPKGDLTNQLKIVFLDALKKGNDGNED